MGISKITRNFQITLPKDIRATNQFNVGDRVLFVADKAKISILKLEKSGLKTATGLWSPVKETGEEYQKKIRSDWKKRQ